MSAQTSANCVGTHRNLIQTYSGRSCSEFDLKLKIFTPSVTLNIVKVKTNHYKKGNTFIKFNFCRIRSTKSDPTKSLLCIKPFLFCFD